MHCDKCKKDFPADQLLRCTRPDDTFPEGEEVEHLCPECVKEDIWYCKGCGVFCAGITSFEFGPYQGFCDNCADQIRCDMRDEEYEEDDYDPNFDPWYEPDNDPIF